MTVDVKYGMACFVMVGYLLFDYLLAKFWIRGNEAIDRQMNFHHVVAAAATLTGVYTGYALSGVANVLLTMEASTVALNYRSLYDKKDFHLFVPTMLQGAFCLQFTTFRIILMPYVYIRFYLKHELFWDAWPADRRAVFWAAATLFGAIMVLNFYWYVLVLKGAAVALGCIKKGKKKSSDAAREPAKAD